jgi:hypothetical protein
MKPLFFLRQHRGVSTVEILISAGLIAASAAGLGTTLIMVFKAKTKATVVRNVLVLESNLTSSFSNDATYENEDLRQQLLAGTPLTAPLPVRLSEDLIINAGQTVCLSTDLQLIQSSACDFANRSHAYEVSSQLRNISGAWRYAYRIKANPKIAAIANLGKINNEEFLEEDFRGLIPRESYDNDFVVSCDQDINGDGVSDFVGMRSYDRINQRAVCIPKPTAGCPIGTLATGIHFVPSADGPGQIEFTCSPALQAVNCPDKYSLTQVNTARMIGAGSGVAGSCEYTASTTVTSPTFTSTGVYGVFCPDDYEVANVSCQLTNVVETAGSCPTFSASCGPWYPDGAGESRDCTYSQTGTAPRPATPPQVRQLRANTDREAGCQVYIPPQQCGSTATAQVQMSVSCRLKSQFQGAQPATLGGM